MPRLLLVLLICLVGFWDLSGLHSLAGAEEPDYGPLCRELAESGLELLNSGLAYGVPYLRHLNATVVAAQAAVLHPRRGVAGEERLSRLHPVVPSRRGGIVSFG